MITIEEAALKAEQVLASFDLSQAPFNMKLSLVKWEDIPSHLIPGVIKPHAIRVESYVKLTGTETMCHLWTHQPVDILKDNIEQWAITVIFNYVLHEISEVIKIDGIVKLDPHALKPNYICSVSVTQHNQG